MTERLTKMVLMLLSTGSSSNPSLKMDPSREGSGVHPLNTSEVGKITKKLASEFKSMKAEINMKEGGTMANVMAKELFGSWMERRT